MAGTAKCQTCGRTFAPCGSCRQQGSAQHWKANCDTPECYQVFFAALEYRDGRMTKQQLKDGLSQLDLDRILIADNAVKKIITGALVEEHPVRARRRASIDVFDSQEEAAQEE